MDSIFREVQEHLQQVTQDPSKPLDQRVLQKLDSNIIENLPAIRRRMLINQLAALLPTLQQDPTPAADIATVLIDSDDNLTFSDVISLQPEVNFVGGLQAPIPALNKVTLALLQKAKTVTDAGLVAGKPELVAALVELWLRTSQTTVAEKARNVLAGLLHAEPPEAHEGDGSPVLSGSQGLMWRRFFNDKDVYGLLFSLCSVATLNQPGQLSRREKTIAQGRLLDLIQDICDAPQIWRSQIPEVEQAYGVEPGSGILEFAAVKMIDYKDDVLIHMTLIDFFTRLIARNNGDILTLNSKRSAGITPHSSEALDFLIAKGLHQRTISYFLNPDQHDSLDATYLYSSSTNYIATYAKHYITHFLQNSASKIIQRLTEVIGRLSNNAWAANNVAPVHDLKLLSSLPQRALLTIDKGALVLSLPTKPANFDAFHALGTILKGPLFPSNAEDLETLVPPPASPAQSSPDLTTPDRAAARALFFLYAQAHPDAFRNLVAAAETVAIKEAALAAVGVIHAVVDSNWAPLPAAPTAPSSSSTSTSTSTSTFTTTSTTNTNTTTTTGHRGFPTEAQLEAQCSAYPSPLPDQGVLAVLQPPAIQHVVPFLMRGPENASEAAWEVAVAKHAAVGSVRRRLRALVEAGMGEGEDWREILATIERRDGEGPGGGRGEHGLAGRMMPTVGTMGR